MISNDKTTDGHLVDEVSSIHTDNDPVILASEVRKSISTAGKAMNPPAVDDTSGRASEMPTPTRGQARLYLLIWMIALI